MIKEFPTAIIGVKRIACSCNNYETLCLDCMMLNVTGNKKNELSDDNRKDLQ